MKNWPQWLSGLIAGLYLLVIWRHEGWQSSMPYLPLLALILGLIWYADAIGHYTGWIGRVPVSRTTPPRLIRAFGWCLLLAPAIMFVIRVFLQHR